MESCNYYEDISDNEISETLEESPSCQPSGLRSRPKYGNDFIVCPICTEKTNIPLQHFIDDHSFPNAQAKSLENQLYQCLPLVTCPICSYKVFRVENHLKKKHGLKPSSLEFHNCVIKSNDTKEVWKKTWYTYDSKHKTGSDFGCNKEYSPMQSIETHMSHDYKGLHLSFTDHQNTLTTEIQNNFDKDVFTDLTIRCGQESISCHRMVLSTASPMLKNMLDGPGDVLIIPEVNISTIRALIHCLYFGKVDVSLDQLGKFMELLKTLDITSISNYSDPEKMPDLQQCAHPRDSGLEESVSVSNPSRTMASESSRGRSSSPESVIFECSHTRSHGKNRPSVHTITIPDTLEGLQTKSLVSTKKSDPDNKKIKTSPAKTSQGLCSEGNFSRPELTVGSCDVKEMMNAWLHEATENSNRKKANAIPTVLYGRNLMEGFNCLISPDDQDTGTLKRNCSADSDEGRKRPGAADKCNATLRNLTHLQTSQVSSTSDQHRPSLVDNGGESVHAQHLLGSRALTKMNNAVSIPGNKKTRKKRNSKTETKVSNQETALACAGDKLSLQTSESVSSKPLKNKSCGEESNLVRQSLGDSAKYPSSSGNETVKVLTPKSSVVQTPGLSKVSTAHLSTDVTSSDDIIIEGLQCNSDPFDSTFRMDQKKRGRKLSPDKPPALVPILKSNKFGRDSVVTSKSDAHITHHSALRNNREASILVETKKVHEVVISGESPRKKGLRVHFDDLHDTCLLPVETVSRNEERDINLSPECLEGPPNKKNHNIKTCKSRECPCKEVDTCQALTGGTRSEDEHTERVLACTAESMIKKGQQRKQTEESPVCGETVTDFSSDEVNKLPKGPHRSKHTVESSRATTQADMNTELSSSRTPLANMSENEVSSGSSNSEEKFSPKATRPAVAVGPADNDGAATVNEPGHVIDVAATVHVDGVDWGKHGIMPSHCWSVNIQKLPVIVQTTPEVKPRKRGRPPLASKLSLENTEKLYSSFIIKNSWSNPSNKSCSNISILKEAVLGFDNLYVNNDLPVVTGAISAEKSEANPSPSKSSRMKSSTTMDASKSSSKNSDSSGKSHVIHENIDNDSSSPKKSVNNNGDKITLPSSPAETLLPEVSRSSRSSRSSLCYPTHFKPSNVSPEKGDKLSDRCRESSLETNSHPPIKISGYRSLNSSWLYCKEKL